MSTRSFARCGLMTLAIAAAACGRRAPNLAADPSGAGTSASDAAGSSGLTGDGDGDGDDDGHGAAGRAGSSDPGDAGHAAPDAGDLELPDPIGPAPEPGITADGALPTGIWIGEFAEALDDTFSTCALGSHRITLQLTAARAGGPAQGTIVFGTHEPPLPVEDPSIEYPPGITVEEASCRSYQAMEGFAYTLRDGRLNESGRFDFRVSVAEPYGPWCAMQVSSPAWRSVTGYLCLPLGVPHDLGTCASDPSCPVSASEYTLCSEVGVCSCYEQGCEANLNRAYRFDLQVTGEAMRGVASAVSNYLGAKEVSLRKVE